MNRFTLSATLLAGLSLVAGCGEGAHEPSDVVLRPSQSTPAGGTATPANGDAANPAQPSAATPDASGYGTFKGKVVLVGGVPERNALVKQGANVKDAEVCAVKPVLDPKWNVGEGNGLQNVFIYLVRAPKNGKDQAGHEKTDQVFDQQGCVFVPHAMVLRVGQPFTITSSDAVLHNIHSRPKRQNEVNMAVEKGAMQQAVYERAEVEPAPVGCDIHNWMQAWQLPLDHPYGIVTDEDGNFEIQDLPVGTHGFRIWYEGKPANNNYQVTISKDGEVVEKTIELPAATL